MRYTKLKIKKGFWYGAGSPKVFNWVKDGYDIKGVGIKLDLLYQFDMIEIEIENELYTLNCVDAIRFVEFYNSKKNIRGTSIGVVSNSLLYPYETN